MRTEAAAARRRDGRARAILLVVALLAASAAAVSAVLVSDGTDAPFVSAKETADAPAALPEVVTVAESSDEEAAGDAVDAVVTVPLVTYEVFLSRDPFQPVVPTDTSTATPISDDGSDDGSGDGSGDGLGDGSGDGTGSGGTGTTQPTDPDEPACSSQGEVVCDGRVVSLIDVTTVDGTPVAVIQVDTTVYEVTVGQQFAGSFVVRSIDGDTVTLLYGDEGIRLLPGDTVLK